MVKRKAEQRSSFWASGRCIGTGGLRETMNVWSMRILYHVKNFFERPCRRFAPTSGFQYRIGTSVARQFCVSISCYCMTANVTKSSFERKEYVSFAAAAAVRMLYGSAFRKNNTSTKLNICKTSRAKARAVKQEVPHPQYEHLLYNIQLYLSPVFPLRLCSH